MACREKGEDRPWAGPTQADATETSPQRRAPFHRLGDVGGSQVARLRAGLQ
jgi:hypothetical protein